MLWMLWGRCCCCWWCSGEVLIRGQRKSDRQEICTTPGSSTIAALAAAAAAVLTTPAAEARTAAGSVVGRMDMHSMTKLLAGPAANMAALSLQLPAGLIPGSTAAQQPTGLGHVGVWGPAGAAAAAAAAAEAGPVLDLVGSSSTPGNYQCTPGVHLTAQTCLAQSITLRGEQHMIMNIWLCNSCHLCPSHCNSHLAGMLSRL